jgi:hypothetical protein
MLYYTIQHRPPCCATVITNTNTIIIIIRVLVILSEISYHPLHCPNSAVFSSVFSLHFSDFLHIFPISHSVFFSFLVFCYLFFRSFLHSLVIRISDIQFSHFSPNFVSYFLSITSYTFLSHLHHVSLSHIFLPSLSITTLSHYSISFLSHLLV